MIGPAQWETPPNAFYVKMQPSMEFFDIIKISGFMKSYQIPQGNGFFDPFRIDYGFDIMTTIHGFTIGFKHECDHPVIFDFAHQSPLYGMMDTEIYLRYETRLTF